MKIICFLESILNKIFKQKYQKILFCLIICSMLIIANIIIFVGVSFLENFFGLFILLLSILIAFYILFLVLKKINTKFSIYNKIKYIINKIYISDKRNFFNKYEMIFFYIGILGFCGLYVFITDKIRFLDHILFWVLYLLFIVFYRLMLHIIYKNKGVLIDEKEKS